MGMKRCEEEVEVLDEWGGDRRRGERTPAKELSVSLVQVRGEGKGEAAKSRRFWGAGDGEERGGGGLCGAGGGEEGWWGRGLVAR